MKVTRIYSDSSGDSHFADHPIDLHDGGPIGNLSDPVPARSVIFRENEPNYDFDWHVAPRRQFIVLLDGVIEIETSTGDKRTFRAGEILLLEDTTGKGHRTRNIERTKRHSLFIPLD